MQNFGVVTDTPLYVTAVQSGVNASDVSLPTFSTQAFPHAPSEN